MARKRGSQDVVVHEVLERSHRIVVHSKVGTSESGGWAGLDEVATFNGKFFAVCGESVLPQGVFTTKQVAHQVI